MSTSQSSIHVLDNPVWSALTGSHAQFAEISGLARRYPVEISLFSAIENLDDEQAWNDLASLSGSEGTPIFARPEFKVRPEWEVIFSGTGVQMLGNKVEGFKDADAISLESSDVPQMLDLVARTEPGPFAPRTIELGGYIGFKEGGKLIAMAGRRLNPQGWCEISAVCTDPDYRGQGLASRLVRTLVANIKQSGDEPFLHASTANVGAIRIYESMGFVLRKEMNFGVFKLL